MNARSTTWNSAGSPSIKLSPATRKGLERPEFDQFAALASKLVRVSKDELDEKRKAD